jgi:glutathione S-transferase
MLVMKFTALVTLAALALTFVFSGKVGSMRRRYGIDAPATTGNVEFEKANRIHYNTIEQLVLFVPLLWLGSNVIGDLPAAGIGVVWLVGRLIYAWGYQQSGDKRGPGMIITMLASFVLFLSVAWGVIAAFMA